MGEEGTSVNGNLIELK